ncbi:MAG: hypothetical protein JW878_10740 [Methanomicrobia archaeon]|nr:hypothetical protein [Methanomicrobia archaeon]
MDLPIVRDILVSIAAIIASYVAIKGLDVWRRQLKGTTEFQLSEQILEKSHKLQDSLRSARGPWMPEGELGLREQETKIDKHESSDERSLKNECYALWKRLDPVSDAVSELKIIKFKAKALRGEEAVQEVDALIKKAFELRTAQNLYCHLKFHDLKRHPYDEKELFKKYRDIVYWTDKDDKYSEEVENIILKIEEKFRPYLK